MIPGYEPAMAASLVEVSNEVLSNTQPKEEEMTTEEAEAILVKRIDANEKAIKRYRRRMNYSSALFVIAALVFLASIIF